MAAVAVNGAGSPGRGGKAARLVRVWREARRSAFYLLLLAALLGGCLALLLANAPKLQEAELALLKRWPPRQPGDLVALRDVLLRYAATNPVFVVAAFTTLYILMQTFAIPGTLWLSLLSGALYGWRRGLLLVSVVSTIGSCTCYCVSWACGKALAHAAWPDRLDRFAAQVAKRRGELLNYIIFLRVTPLLPNTFINVASPIVGVPLGQFALGTLLGCLPNNYLAVNAGERLGEVHSLAELYDSRMLLTGLVTGTIAVLPVYLKHRHERQLAKSKQV